MVVLPKVWLWNSLKVASTALRPLLQCLMLWMLQCLGHLHAGVIPFRFLVVTRFDFMWFFMSIASPDYITWLIKSILHQNLHSNKNKIPHQHSQTDFQVNCGLNLKGEDTKCLFIDIGPMNICLIWLKSLKTSKTGILEERIGSSKASNFFFQQEYIRLLYIRHPRLASRANSRAKHPARETCPVLTKCHFCHPCLGDDCI